MCIYLRFRSKKYQKYIYCKKKKKEISFCDCKNCKYKTFKEVKELKKKSKKQKKIENNRFSIITNNFKICYICNKNKKEDLHEIFGGCNRGKSMQWGLVIPICRECHQEWKTNKELRIKYQQEAQFKFEDQYDHELFMQEFRKNYI